MAIVSRHEVRELIVKFQDKHYPKDNPKVSLASMIGNSDFLFQAINPLVWELDNTSGPVSQVVKNSTRILKHFVELPAGPEVVAHFNYAMMQVRLQGADPTKVLKRLRTDYAAYKARQEKERVRFGKEFQKMAELEAKSATA